MLLFSRGGGLALERNIPSNNENTNFNIELSKYTFKRCNITYGEVIFLYLEDSRPSIIDKFKYDKVVFITNSIRNIAKYGQNIFLISYDLKKYASGEYFAMIKIDNTNKLRDNGIELYSCTTYKLYSSHNCVVCEIWAFSRGSYFKDKIYINIIREVIVHIVLKNIILVNDWIL